MITDVYAAVIAWMEANRFEPVAPMFNILDKPALTFGNAHDWDPLNPLETASHPDNLLLYLNTTALALDEACRDCVWLPMCAGGCPYHRLLGQRTCLPFMDDPESFVLAPYDRYRESLAVTMIE